MLRAIQTAVTGALVAPEPSRIDILAEYSRTSGAVGWIQIGSELVNVKVSFDLQASGLRFWRYNFCPPFVDGGCYNPLSSGSLQITGKGTSGEVIAGIDDLQIGQQRFADNRFSVTNPWCTYSAEDVYYGHDVAGSLGLGPGADFIGSRILMISEQGQPNLKVRLQAIEPTNDICYPTRFPVSRGGWMFSASINNKRIRFGLNLHERGIVFPESTIETVLERLWGERNYQLQNNQVIAACDSINGIDLALGECDNGSSLTIHIARELLIAKHITEQPGNCKLNIWSNPAVKAAVIGRMITSNISGVVMNYKTQRIGFKIHSTYIGN